MREITIAGRRIADDTPPYLIAEIGNTHNGSVDRARELIEVASLCGADAVKLQRKSVDTLYSPEMLAKPYDGLGPTYGEHKRALELSLSEVASLQKVAADANVALFATPFDEASADDLHALGMPAFKIHSGGLSDLDLIRHVSTYRKPVILSTGGGKTEDIDEALDVIIDHCEVAILHCTAIYPVAHAGQLNLGCINTLRERYTRYVIGWSAHDVTPDRAGVDHKVLAYGLGARIIEVHFTLDHDLPGTDHRFALEPSGLRKLSSVLHHAHVVMGDGVKQPLPEEEKALAKMRRDPQSHQITGASYATA